MLIGFEVLDGTVYFLTSTGGITANPLQAYMGAYCDTHKIAKDFNQYMQFWEFNMVWDGENRALSLRRGLPITPSLSLDMFRTVWGRRPFDYMHRESAIMSDRLFEEVWATNRCS